MQGLDGLLPGGCFGVYIFPRQPQRASFGGGMGIALLEVIGQAICTEPDVYDSLTADVYEAELRANSLPAWGTDKFNEAVIQKMHRKNEPYPNL